MSNDKRAYGREEREDAFGELARAGYASVPGAPGEHAERLARLRARTGAQPSVQRAPDGTPEGASAKRATGDAKVVRLGGRRRTPVWWAAAAAILLVVTVALLYRQAGDTLSEPVAAVLETERAPADYPTVADGPAAGASSDATESYGPDATSAEAMPPAEPAVARVEAPAPPRRPQASPAPTASPTAPAPSERPAIADATAAAAPPAAESRTTPLEVDAARAPDPVAGRFGEASADVLAEAATIEQAQSAEGAEADDLAGGAIADARNAARAAAESAVAEPMPAPPAAPARQTRARAPGADRETEAPTDAAAPAPGDSGAAKRYGMRREAVPELRRVTGTFLDEGGTPVEGAVIEVEGTGQRLEVGEDGRFDLALTPVGRVGRFTVADAEDTLYVNLALAERFAVVWPRKSPPSSRPEVRGGGHSTVLAPLPAPAPRNPDFDAYLAARGTPLGQPVELLFSVSRQGRPTGIRLGPSYEASREVYRRARALLEAGPDWGERWRRERWRYVLE